MVCSISIRFFYLCFFLGIWICTAALSEICPTSNLEKGFQKILRTTRELNLGENEDSAALVKFSFNSSNFKRYDECRFKVVAKIKDDTTRNRGIFVSIRRLNLRKHPISDECIDYIRFKFGNELSPKYCGQLNASIDDVKKIYFGEGGGVIIVDIKLDTFLPFQYIHDTLDIELIFTANEGNFR